MANTVNVPVQFKRTSISGKVPNTTNIPLAGEPAINMADGIMYVSTGSDVFPVGANNVNLNVSNTANLNIIAANGTIGVDGQVLTSNGSGVYWATKVGYSGSMGYTGSLGYTGSIGYTGSQGTAGTTGFTGSQGSIGYTGSSGGGGGVTALAGTANQISVSAATGNVTISFPSTVNIGILKGTQIFEIVSGVTPSLSGGVASFDCSTSQVFDVTMTNINQNFTANFTNLNLAANTATTVSLILRQGNTGWYANAVQIGGVGQTLNWQGGSTPSATANKKDIIAFNITNISGTYTTYSQLVSFG